MANGYIHRYVHTHLFVSEADWEAIQFLDFFVISRRLAAQLLNQADDRMPIAEF